MASWAKKMSWKEVAETFGVSWDTVYKAVSAIVEYGLAHRDLDGITAIGVDEIQYKKGHNYLTLVYQIDACSRRLLFIGKDRTAKTLLRFFREFGQERTKNLKFVCSDMWKPYLKVIRKKAINALNILDRFHIVKKLNEAVDKVRREEVYKAKKDGFTATKLKKTKYCFLKNKENLTVNQQTRLNDIIKCDFASVKAYFLKEAFRHFWSYTTWRWAEWFLDKWCDEVTDSGLEPLCGFVNTLNKHRHLIENWFKAKKAYSSGIVEGLNRKINLVTRKSYGFRTEKVLEIALFHTMGDLPEPKFPHKFL